MARRACAAGANTFAYSAPSARYDLNGLCFNAAFQGEKATTNLQRGVTGHFHPEKCDTVKSIFDHEFGHKIDEMLGQLHKDGDFLTIYKEADNKGAEYIKDNLSEYAYYPKLFKKPNYTPQKEFIAEAWSEYLNNENPRPISSAVGMLIKKKYDAMHKDHSKP